MKKQTDNEKKFRELAPWLIGVAILVLFLMVAQSGVTL